MVTGFPRWSVLSVAAVWGWGTLSPITLWNCISLLLSVSLCHLSGRSAWAGPVPGHHCFSLSSPHAQEPQGSGSVQLRSQLRGFCTDIWIPGRQVVIKVMCDFSLQGWQEAKARVSQIPLGKHTAGDFHRHKETSYLKSSALSIYRHGI